VVLFDRAKNSDRETLVYRSFSTMLKPGETDLAIEVDQLFAIAWLLTSMPARLAAVREANGGTYEILIDSF
jgi:hypothetical protein